jgi:hypothetical protein
MGCGLLGEEKDNAETRRGAEIPQREEILRGQAKRDRSAARPRRAKKRRARESRVASAQDDGFQTG